MLLTLLNASIKELLRCIASFFLSYLKLSTANYTYRGHLKGSLKVLEHQLKAVDTTFDIVYKESHVKLPTRYTIPDVCDLCTTLDTTMDSHTLIDSFFEFYRHIRLYNSVHEHANRIVRFTNHYDQLMKTAIVKMNKPELELAIHVVPTDVRESVLKRITGCSSDVEHEVFFGNTSSKASRIYDDMLRMQEHIDAFLAKSLMLNPQRY